MAGVNSVTNEALPFSGVDSIDGEAGSNASSSNASPHTNSGGNVPNNANTNANSNFGTTGHTAKRRRMSTDSVSEHPSSAVSYSSYGGDSFRTGSGAMSAVPTLFSEGAVTMRFGTTSSNGGGAERSPQFVHPPMLPEATGTSDGHAHGHGRSGHGYGMEQHGYEYGQGEYYETGIMQQY
ncbi:hypothetical protein BDR07DRAFT_1381318 [Suillus spraguei]|nr:hypothetical protein BDR07DRAFT_1381318 [Suillus spraguei]